MTHLLKFTVKPEFNNLCFSSGKEEFKNLLKYNRSFDDKVKIITIDGKKLYHILVKTKICNEIHEIWTNIDHLKTREDVHTYFEIYKSLYNDNNHDVGEHMLGVIDTPESSNVIRKFGKRKKNKISKPKNLQSI